MALSMNHEDTFGLSGGGRLECFEEGFSCRIPIVSMQVQCFVGWNPSRAETMEAMGAQVRAAREKWLAILGELHGLCVRFARWESWVGRGRVSVGAFPIVLPEALNVVDLFDQVREGGFSALLIPMFGLRAFRFLSALCHERAFQFCWL